MEMARAERFELLTFWFVVERGKIQVPYRPLLRGWQILKANVNSATKVWGASPAPPGSFNRADEFRQRGAHSPAVAAMRLCCGVL